MQHPGGQRCLPPKPGISGGSSGHEETTETYFQVSVTVMKKRADNSGLNPDGSVGPLRFTAVLFIRQDNTDFYCSGEAQRLLVSSRPASRVTGTYLQAQRALEAESRPSP